MAAAAEEVPFHHNGTLEGLLDYVEKKVMTPLGKVNPVSAPRRHAENHVATLERVDERMKEFNVNKDADMEEEKRLTKVALAFHFNKLRFMLSRVDVISNIKSPRVFACDSEKPEGSKSIETLLKCGFTEAGVTWLDGNQHVSEVAQLHEDEGALAELEATKEAERTALRTKLFEAQGALQKIGAVKEASSLILERQIVKAIGALSSALECLEDRAPGVAAGGGDGGGSAGDGLEKANEEPPVLISSEFPEMKTIEDLIGCVEEGKDGSSSLLKWGAAESQDARERAWGTGPSKMKKKLATYYQAYALVKLSVHWGTLDKNKNLIMADLKMPRVARSLQTRVSATKRSLILMGGHLRPPFNMAGQKIPTGAWH
mmetsp:Transcript_50520/g.114721  ORF Transcript_50520/g.114721 Transcript_50520/m.114721 type:complete len:373 (+) Transcript_50520:214-1332(+)